MGQLGHGSDINVRKPRLILKNKKIHEIACGRYHSLAINEYGILYSWGCGESGQLAHNNLFNIAFPKPVESALTCVIGQISCGEHHSFAITSIPHNDIALDVKTWLDLEYEELKVKEDMLANKSINGLKSKDIALIAKYKRKELVQAYEMKKNNEKLLMTKHLTEQVKSIEYKAGPKAKQVTVLKDQQQQKDKKDEGLKLKDQDKHDMDTTTLHNTHFNFNKTIETNWDYHHDDNDENIMKEFHKTLNRRNKLRKESLIVQDDDNKLVPKSLKNRTIGLALLPRIVIICGVLIKNKQKKKKN